LTSPTDTKIEAITNDAQDQHGVLLRRTELAGDWLIGGAGRGDGLGGWLAEGTGWLAVWLRGLAGWWLAGCLAEGTGSLASWLTSLLAD